MKRWWLVVIVSLIMLALAVPANGKVIPRQQIQLAAATPVISLSPTSGKQGQLITVHGAGFHCQNSTAVADIAFDGTVMNGAGTAIACDGSFVASFRVPLTASKGTHTVTAEGMAPQPAGKAPATATPTSVPPATPTDTPVPPTATNTPVPTSALPSPTPTSTLVPPTATSTPTPTSTPTLTPTPTNTPAILVVPSHFTPEPPRATSTPTPTNTPTPRPTATPTSTPLPPTPTPTPTVCSTPACFMDQSSSASRAGAVSSHGPSQPSDLTYHMVTVRHSAGRAQATLAFDGDRASTNFVVTAPAPPPFTITQSATCSSPPTVGVTTTCTITERVTNNSNNTWSFAHTVTNHLARNVRAVSATASTGTTVVSGSSVVWNNFSLGPGQTASATIRVSFTPSAAQVGTNVILSDGITASAVNVATGKRFSVTYGTLSTHVRVRPATQGAGRVVAAPVRPGAGARTTGAAQPQASATQNRLGGLPTTGGGARRKDGEYVIP